MTSSASTTPGRRALARHLRGHGLELGPGHEPFPLPSGADVRYVDRWSPEDNRALFPELDDAAFPMPDLISNLDVDRLRAVDDGSVDFVVASHVLEHLADPIGMLDEIHRVLRVGGVALILLPDRRTTFDATRAGTALEHLTEEHAAGVTEVSDAHIIEFVQAVDPAAAAPTPALIDQHRNRSIHVHCWTEEEFLPVVTYGVRTLGHRWELVDGLRTGAPHSVGIEFGLVVRKAAGTDAEASAGRLEADWRAWYDAHVVPAPPDQSEVVALRARVDALEASTSWRITAPLRAMGARARGWRR